MPNDEDLITIRIVNAFLASGILPCQLSKFCDAFGIETVPRRTLDAFINNHAKQVTILIPWTL